MKKRILDTFISGVSLLVLSLCPIQAHTQEKVQVQTDREIYIAGENLFFSIRVLPADNAASNICYMLLRNSDQVFNKLYLHAENGISYGSFVIPDTLKTGYYEVVAFTNHMRNFGELAFFRKQVLVVNRFDDKLDGLRLKETENRGYLPQKKQAPLDIRVEKDSLHTRSEVRLIIKPGADFNEHYNPFVTITVKQNIRLIADDAFPGNIDNAKQVQNTEIIKYPKERTGIYLDGRVLDRDAVPLKNECLYLSTPDTFVNLQYAYSDGDGKFRFFIPGYYMGKQMFINTRERRDDIAILTDDKFRLQSGFEPSPVEMTPELRKYILESQEVVRIQKSYQVRNTRSIPDSIHPRIPYVYGEAASVIYPSRYVRLNDLKEIAGNIIADFRIRDEDGRFLPYVINSGTTQFFSEPASIFVDGLPVHDLNPFMKWSSDNIKKIELCKSLRIKGDIAFPGIVAIFSIRDKEADNIKTGEVPVWDMIVPGAHSYSMGGFSEHTRYDPPRYSSKATSGPLPDFRQLLYWDPKIELKGESVTVSFYTSDWPAEYIVEVSGNDREGESYHVTSKLKVYE